MAMKHKPWFKWGCLTPLAVVSALILTGYIALSILGSPSNVLKHALHLQTLPPTIKRLRMGSDVWTDEVRGFCFEIAPAEFPLLLTGRDFELTDRGICQARTIHVKPAVTFPARWHYTWKTTGAHCTIDASEAKDRVVIIFAAD
jgi:hypothetical protein